MDENFAIEMEHISKSFPGIKANDEDQWFDIGKPETLKQAEIWLNRKNSLLKS